MMKGQKYYINQLKFETGLKLGVGGFGSVTEYDFHGHNSAYKRARIHYDPKSTRTVKIKVNSGSFIC